MKRTQNEKILQIKNETLVVGIDIGKETHYARAFDSRGIELAKLLRFSNSAEGYNALRTWMQSTMQQKGKTDAIVGFEPTGHYWFSLGDYLRNQGYKLGIVNPYHVKCARELDDNRQTKTDLKDPKTIAMLVKDGRYRDVYIPSNCYQELREAVLERERLVEQMTALSNQVIRWLDIRFPEFTKVFKSWKGKTAFATLKQFPTPVKVAQAGPEGLIALWQQHVKRNYALKAQQLFQAAKTSIGRVSGSNAAEVVLQNLLVQYELAASQLEQIEALLSDLVLTVPHSDTLLDVKGIGKLSTAVIISEIGEIQRFSSPRQIVSLAGLSLIENSSGRHKGQTTISKRGRKRLREALFRVMIPLLANNAEFRAMHQRNITRDQNPLTKMQSVIALCGKLIRVIYALLSKGCRYDASKLVQDMNRSMMAA